MRTLVTALALLAACCGTHAGTERVGRYFARTDDGEVLWVHGRNYYALSEQVVTPHIPWAKPWAMGPVKALVISPAGCHRETIELAQRLSLSYDALIMPDAGDSLTCDNLPRFYGLEPDDTIREYRAKLGAEYDVIILGACQWSIFPPDIEAQLLEKLESGTGLVLAHQWDGGGETLEEILARPRDRAGERHIARAVPISQIPGHTDAGGQTDIHCVRVGDGRLVKLSYPGDSQNPRAVISLTPECPEDRALPATLYDYYQALAIRAVVWAAGKEAPQQIESISLASTDSILTIAATNAARRSPATVEVATRDWWGPERIHATSQVALPPDTCRLTIELPRLPGGRQFLDVWLRTPEGEVLDWASALVDVSPPASIEAIQLSRRSFPAGSPVTGQVSVSGEMAADARLRLELRDSFGRRLAEQESAPGRVPQAFSFPFDSPVAIQHEVVASLCDQHGLIDQSRQLFAVAELAYDDFAFICWNAGGSNIYRSRMIAEQAYRLGVDSCYDRGRAADWDQNPFAYWTTRAGLSQFFYATYLGGLPDADHVRSRCLSDPDFREATTREIMDRARDNKHLGGIGYSTGDEYRLSDQGRDLCWSPHCLTRLRGHLQEKYRTLDALNAAWKTGFAAWDDVIPDTREEAIERGHFTAWAENRAFSEFVFADIHRHLREAVETIHEGVPVGEEGMFDADTYFGVDWEKFRSAATLVQGYERPRQHEHIRSLFPKTTLTGYWIGYYTRDYSEEKMRWHPWHALFNGYNSVWWFTAAMMGPRGWPVAFAADLTPQDPFRWTAEEVHAIKRGIGKLILDAERQHDGVAILYSMPSIRAADAHPEIGVQIGSEHYEGTIKSSELAWCLLIEDLGMQYEFVSHRDVAHGLLRSGDYRVLVLPTSVAMSEGEAAAIRAFVREGGTVLADMWPGQMDEWANILPRGRLDDVFGVNLSDQIALTFADLSLAHDGAQRRVPNRRANPAVRLTGGRARAMAGDTPAFIEHTFGRGRAHLLNVSINDYFSDWHRRQDHVDIRWTETGVVVRDHIAAQLSHAGVEPRVQLRHGDGRPIVGCEAIFFQRDDIRYLGLEYVPNLIYFANGDLDYQFRTFSLDPDVSPTPLAVALDDRYHVYDVRRTEYLGQTAEFDTAISPGQGLLFALLPYHLREIDLRVDTDEIVPIGLDQVRTAMHPRVSVELRTASASTPLRRQRQTEPPDDSPAFGQTCQSTGHLLSQAQIARASAMLRRRLA